MSTGDATGLLTAIATIYLLWQQNQIFKKQNDIFASQSGTSKATMANDGRARATQKMRRYWPMLVMGLLAIATFAGIGYQRSVPDTLREFDAKRQGISVVSYGMLDPSSCYMDVVGKTLISRASWYKMAIGCFIYSGTQDILDAPFLQVSSLYDIKDIEGVTHMRVVFSEPYVKYRIQQGANGTNIALLNVPNGIQNYQFSTLRQARSLGVSILEIESQTSKVTVQAPMDTAPLMHF